MHYAKYAKVNIISICPDDSCWKFLEVWTMLCKLVQHLTWFDFTCANGFTELWYSCLSTQVRSVLHRQSDRQRQFIVLIMFRTVFTVQFISVVHNSPSPLYGVERRGTHRRFNDHDVTVSAVLYHPCSQHCLEHNQSMSDAWQHLPPVQVQLQVYGHICNTKGTFTAEVSTDKQ